MITAKCPHCQAGVRGEDQFAGRVVACPKCKKQLQMPTVPKPNVETNPVAQSPRSAPKLPQNPVSQPDARAVMSKPGAADSDDTMSRQMKIAMIALPAVAVIVGAIFIWSFEKSRQEARRQGAQVAAQKIYDEAQQALGQSNIPEAVQKLNTYLSDEKATKTSEAKKFLAEIELATSENAASDTLVKMGEKDFQQFQQSRHYSDARITHPTLAKLWDSLLMAASAKRLVELEKRKKEQAELAVARRKAKENQTPAQQRISDLKAEFFADSAAFHRGPLKEMTSTQRNEWNRRFFEDRWFNRRISVTATIKDVVTKYDPFLLTIYFITNDFPALRSAWVDELIGDENERKIKVLPKGAVVVLELKTFGHPASSEELDKIHGFAEGQESQLEEFMNSVFLERVTFLISNISEVR